MIVHHRVNSFCFVQIVKIKIGEQTMREKKVVEMITRMLAWLLALVMLCTSVPVDGIKVYAVENENLNGESSDMIEDNGIYGNQSDDNNSIDNQEKYDDVEIIRGKDTTTTDEKIETAVTNPSEEETIIEDTNCEEDPSDDLKYDENSISIATSSDIASGKGTGTFTWRIDSAGTLYITGTGDLWSDFHTDTGRIPSWYQYRTNINKAIVNCNGMNTMSRWFYGLENCKSIEFGERFDSSNVIIMFGVFGECSSLTELDLRNLNTSSVTNMGAMFSGCKNIEKINLSSFDTKNVKNMSYMFEGCGDYVEGFLEKDTYTGLSKLDLSNFDTRNVTDMNRMFMGCHNLQELNISSFNTHNVTDMSYMFTGCQSIERIDLSSFDTINVTNMYAMFSGCGDSYGDSGEFYSGISELDLSSFDTRNVTNMGSMFVGCYNLQSINVGRFDTSNVSNMAYMFNACSSLVTLDLSSFDTNNASSMSGMFLGCASLERLDLSNFNTSNVRSFGWMFRGCSSLVELDLSSMDMSKSSDEIEWLFDDFGPTNLKYLKSPYKIREDQKIQLPKELFSSLTWYNSKKEIVTYIHGPITNSEEYYRSDYEGPIGGKRDYKKSNASVMLTISDELGKPISNAIIDVDGSKYYSNLKGAVQIYVPADAKKKATINKTGYSTKTVTLDANTQTSIRVVMSKKSDSTSSTLLQSDPIKNVKVPSPKIKIPLESSVKFGKNTLKWLALDGFEVTPFKVDNGNGLPMSIKLKASYDTDEDLWKFTFGVEEKDEVEGKFDGNGLYKNVKEACDLSEKALNNGNVPKKIERLLDELAAENAPGTIGIDVKTKILGYFSLQDLGDGNYQIVESGCIVGFSGSGEISYRPVCTGGVVYVKAALTLSANGTLGISLDYDNNNIESQGIFDFKEEVKIGGGVGSKNLHTEVGFQGAFKEQAKFTTTRPAIPETDFKVTATGDLYLEAKAWVLKKDLKQKLFDVQLYPKPEVVPGGSGGGGGTAWSLGIMSESLDNQDEFDQNSLKPIGRSYLLQNKQKTGTKNIHNEKKLSAQSIADDSVVADTEYVYPYATPTIARLADGTLLAVWVSDLGTKSDMNRTSLVYATNDGNGWSESRLVYEDGKAAFYPDLAVSANQVYLTWIAMDKELTDSATEEDFAKATNVMVSTYKDGTFTEPICISAKGNNKLEMLPKVACSENEIAVTWVENSVNDPFLEEGVNTIHVSTFDAKKSNAAWKKSIIKTDLTAVNSIDLGYTSEGLTIAYIMDMDGMSDTTDDLEVFTLHDGITTRLTSNYYAERNVLFDNEELYWADDSGLYVAEDATPNKTRLYELFHIDNFEIINDGIEKRIVYPVIEGFTGSLYSGVIGESQITELKPIADYNDKIEGYAVSKNVEGKLSGIIVETLMDEDEESPYGFSKLHKDNKMHANNISLSGVSYDVADMESGEALPISLTITNGSSQDMSKVQVRMESGASAQTKTVDCQIPAGGSGEIIVNYDMGGNRTSRDIDVTVIPEGFTDNHMEDNSESIGIAYRDVEIKEVSAEETGIVRVTIGNTGAETMSNVVVNLRERGEEGAIINSWNYGSMAAGAEEQIEYTIAESYLDYNNCYDNKHFYLELVTEEEEAKYANNSAIITVFPIRVSGIVIDKEYLSMNTGEVGTIQATVLPENAEDKTVHYLTSNANVVVVTDNGKLIATGEGEAIITAISTDGSFEKTCEIVVSEEANNYEISEPAFGLKKGEEKVIAVIDTSLDDENAVNGIIWNSETPSIVEVKSDGTVVGKTAGVGIITATDSNNRVYASRVFVENDSLETIILSEDRLTLTEGESKKVKASVVENSEVAFTWESSNDEVATVDSNGTITAVASGVAKITATTENGKSASLVVEVAALPRATVRFDDSIGGKVIEIEDVLIGECVELPENPQRDGYEFLGWYTERNGLGECFTNDTFIEDSITVYAAWEYTAVMHTWGELTEEDRIAIGSVEEIPRGLWVAGLKEEGYTYTGKVLKPVIRVYDGNVLLKEKTDYTVTYKNNTKVYDIASTEDGFDSKIAPTITISGKGNYKDQEVIYFTIQKKNLQETDVKVATIPSIIENGKVYKPIPTLTYEGKKLSTKSDIDVAYYDNEEMAGIPIEPKAPKTYYVKISGKGSFTGEIHTSFSIEGTTKKLVNKLSIGKIKDIPYTGEPIDLTTEQLVVKDGKTALTRGIDYQVEFPEDHTNPGSVTIKIVGMGAVYVGEKTTTFKIVGISIKKAKIEQLIASYTYTGEPQLQDTMKLYYNGDEISGKAKETYELLADAEKRNYDYIYEYQNNTQAGTAKILITGVNRFSDSITKTYKIIPFDISKDTQDQFNVILKSDHNLYCKSGVKPDVTVTFNGEELTFGRDYSLNWSNNTKVTTGSEAKKPTVVVTGKGNFKGKDATTNFTIDRRSIDDGSIYVEAKDVVFKDQAGNYKTTIVVKDVDGKILKAGTDYEKEIEYLTLADESVDVKNPISVGTKLKVRITGKGGYTGAVSGNYRIVARDIGKLKIAVLPKDYTGKDIYLSESDFAFYDGKKLLDNVTYDILDDTYKNNVKKGKATVEIQGTGNYGGKKTITFTIGAKGFKWWWNNLKNMF